jgi:hypothetical protein
MIRVDSLRASSLAAVLACVPAKVDTTDATTDGSGSDGSSTSLSPTTGSSTGEFACTPGPIAGEHACILAGLATAQWWVSLDVFTSSFDETCTLVAVDDDSFTQQTLVLDCPSEQLELSLTTLSPRVLLAVTPGTTVHLQYQSIPNGDVEDSGHFTLFDDQDVLLAAGVSGPAAPLTFGPLTYDVRSTTCEGFGDPCSVTQRAALEVTMDDENVVLFSGYSGAIGSAPGYRILVEYVSREDCSTDDLSRPDCTPPNYAAWSVEALFIRSAD